MDIIVWYKAGSINFVDEQVPPQEEELNPITEKARSETSAWHGGMVVPCDWNKLDTFISNEMEKHHLVQWTWRLNAAPPAVTNGILQEIRHVNWFIDHYFYSFYEKKLGLYWLHGRCSCLKSLLLCVSHSKVSLYHTFLQYNLHCLVIWIEFLLKLKCGGCYTIVGGLRVFGMNHCVFWDCYIHEQKNTLLFPVTQEIVEVTWYLSS